MRLGADAAIGMSFGTALSPEWFELLYDDPEQAQAFYNIHAAAMRGINRLRERNERN